MTSLSYVALFNAARPAFDALPVKLTPEQAALTYLSHVGALLHVLAPDWGGWDTPEGEKATVDPESALHSAALVLGHAVMLELANGRGADVQAAVPLGASTSMYQLLLSLTLTGDKDKTCFGLHASALCGVVARYGLTPEDLAAAYYRLCAGGVPRDE